MDVGGDVAAGGGEPDLRSPLADLMALGACCRQDFDVDVAILGVGLDGELPVDYVRERIAGAGGRPGPRLGPEHVKLVEPLLAWHPSEASGMLAAAARGIRGIVEVRDAGSRIVLDDNAVHTWLVPARTMAGNSPLAAALADASSLPEAEAIVREICGRSELDYERSKAATLRSASEEDPTDPAEASRRYRTFMEQAAARGVDLVSMRRLAEQTRAPRGPGFEAWRTALINAEPERYVPPLWRVSADKPQD